MEPVDDRYEDLGRIGMGGMAEVRRVFDNRLQRVLAMKISRTGIAQHTLDRFVHEAQVTAQLQHPGIIPVHDFGTTPQGRVWMTMKQVRGRTLRQVIDAVHAASDGDWNAAEDGWTFRRVVDALRRVCEAVAYAHEKNVVHRDLKPDNVMVGDHGEVLVLDWGLAKIREGGAGTDETTWDHGPEPDAVVMTDRAADPAMRTRDGQVAGTPAYMPPEQARGKLSAVDQRSDVYALGAMLYHALAGIPPFVGFDALEVLERVLNESPPTLVDGGTSGPPLPPELVSACETAMARNPAERFATAAELGAELAAWLDGARRREQALEVTREALMLADRVTRLQTDAQRMQEDGEAALRALPSWADVDAKRDAWHQLEQAESRRVEAEALDLALEQGLQAALRIDAGCPDTHAALAARFLTRHRDAEDRRDPDARHVETLLRAHVAALPRTDARHERYTSYLDGSGRVTLASEPPGADVELFVFETQDRRRIPRSLGSIGTTPLSKPLPMGSYLAVLRHPDRAEVRYPFAIRREEHWDGAPPGSRGPLPIPLPASDALGPDDHYVPAGWFTSGGDPLAPDALPQRRLWCPGFVVRTHPVTNREFVAFLDALVDSGREEEALRWAPRERALQGVRGALSYGRDAAGHFVLVADAEGDVWLPDHPVLNVDWGGAAAFARWTAANTGLPWRLAGELEWEKAARGVDGRWFPWGDEPDPSFAHMRDSHPDRALPAPVGGYPADTSVYGVRGMAGNLRDWCGDILTPHGPEVDGSTVVPPLPPEVIEVTPSVRRAARGGAWNGFAEAMRCAARFGHRPTGRSAVVSLRLFRSFPPVSTD